MRHSQHKVQMHQSVRSLRRQCGRSRFHGSKSSCLLACWNWDQQWPRYGECSKQNENLLRLTSPKLSTSTTMTWSWSILLIKEICRVKDQWGDSQTCAFRMNAAVHRSFKNFICSYYIFVLSLSLSLSIYHCVLSHDVPRDHKICRTLDPLTFHWLLPFALG